jgi:hypothetical protein
VLISLAIAAPVIAKDIRRDKEVESMHRAQQYVRAIRMYQRTCRCAAYPPSMEALEKNNTVRFLRQRYVDPLTGKSDWRLIHDPQTKIHPFFDKTFDDLPAGSLGAAQGMASAGQPGGIIGGATTVSNASPLSAGLAGATVGAAGTSGATGASGASGSSSSDTGMFGDSNGGPIKGVGTARTGESILTPNGQTTYDTWEFWWDPRMERLYATSNILGGGGIGAAQSASSIGLNGLSGATGSTGAGGLMGSGAGLGAGGSTGPR